MFASQQAGIWWLIRVNNKFKFGPNCGTTLKELGLSFLVAYIEEVNTVISTNSLKTTYIWSQLNAHMQTSCLDYHSLIYLSEEMKNTSVKNATFHLQEGRWQSPAMIIPELRERPHWRGLMWWISFPVFFFSAWWGSMDFTRHEGMK